MFLPVPKGCFVSCFAIPGTIFLVMLNVMEAKKDDNTHLVGKTISIQSDQDINYWCAQLGCNQEDLVQSIMRIGNSAKMVDDFLILNRRKNYNYGK